MTAPVPWLLLGDDLSELVRARGVPLVQVLEVTALPSPNISRRSFRLDFADGTRLKGRRHRSAEKARVVERLLPASPHYAQLVGRRGAGSLEEWIEGPRLGRGAGVTPDLLVRAGRMLGLLHVGPRPPGEVLRPVDHFERRLRENLAALAEAILLSQDECDRALELALAHRPADAEYGLIHQDFCPANLVLARDRGLVSIDNEGLRVDPLDLDLARAWYRWPLNPGSWAHFAEGYRTGRSPRSFERHFAFWLIDVLALSAALRQRELSARTEVPIARLHALLNQDRDQPAGA